MAPVKKCPACENFASTSFERVVNHLKRKHAFTENTSLFCTLKACGKEVKSLLELCEHYETHDKPCTHCVCCPCKCSRRLQCKSKLKIVSDLQKYDFKQKLCK